MIAGKFMCKKLNESTVPGRREQLVGTFFLLCEEFECRMRIVCLNIEAEKNKTQERCVRSVYTQAIQS